LDGNPGNIFVEGTPVTIPSLPEKKGRWEVLDVDDRPVASGLSVSGAFELGALPVGHYRLLVEGELAATAAVIKPLSVPIPEDSPVCVHLWSTGNYILERIDSIENAVNLAALAGVNSVHDAVGWTWQQDRKGQWIVEGRKPESFAKLLDAVREHHIRLLAMILPGTPEGLAVPADWGTRRQIKFPADLREYARFVRAIVGRGGEDVSAWEAWNEPEGIGGHHLGSEVASATKVFTLAARSVRPGVHSAMGMGHLPAEALNRNEYLTAVDSYNYHSHRDPGSVTAKRRNLDGFTGQRPVWITELSYRAYPSLRGSTELRPEAERRQARDVPKIFARGIHDGHERVYYFTMLQFGETSDKQWGLLRSRTLQPRQGYLSLAAAGRFLAGAKPAGALEGLPDGFEGWSFLAKPDGIEKGVLVIWSESGRATSWHPPEGARLFDLWGRELEAREELMVGSDPVWCVVSPGTLNTLLRRPCLVRPPMKRPSPGELSPVVADFRRPERLKNLSGDYFLFTQPHPELLIDVYNFSDRPQEGKWTVEAPEGFSAEVLEQPGLLAVDDRKFLRVRLSRRSAWTPESGREVAWLKFTGDYGTPVRSVLAIPFVHCPTDATPGKWVPVAGVADSSNWKDHAAKGTRVSVESDKKWTQFAIRFGPPPNATIGTVWAAPVFAFSPSEHPPVETWGIGLRFRTISAPPGTSFAINVIKRNGAAWTCPLPFEAKEAAGVEGSRLVLPLSWFAHMGYRAPDADGTLLPSDIVAMEIQAVGLPSSSVEIDLADLAWALGPSE
jgi:hypothetical protein